MMMGPFKRPQERIIMDEGKVSGSCQIDTLRDGDGDGGVSG